MMVEEVVLFATNRLFGRAEKSLAQDGNLLDA
jgi:hypothetical protein